MQTEADPLCQPAASLYAEYEARQTLASQAHELSREDLRRTWSVVDVLTSLKRNTSHSPTAAPQVTAPEAPSRAETAQHQQITNPYHQHLKTRFFRP